MANWYNDTSRPRYWGTDTSDIYNGEIMETTPIPTPPMMRYITSSLKEDANAQPMADAENSMAERIIVFFRPPLSLRIPAQATPPIEPINAQPTYHPA